ncbi:MAG: HAD-IC family P-type ATPase [Acholeplasmatales bacterium]|nr:HAD-IC family P-type ATPase [Acholeplasmatales bacterium]
MKKDQNFDEFDEKDLTEYLAKTADEDLTADESDSDDGDAAVYQNPVDKIEVHESRARVLEEVEMQPKSEQKKIRKAEEKEKKKLNKEKMKKIKKHRRELKKHPSTLLRYDTDPEFGLPNEVVEERILDELVNKTGEMKTKSIGRIVFSNVVTFFNILIFIIAGILIALSVIYERWEPITDLSFLLIVLINITIGIIQEIRAKKMIDGLSLMNAPYAIVKRNGINKEIPVDEVVLDDLILLDSGKQICADSIVVEGQVEVNESLLTGESDAIIKKPGDQLLSGSFVVAGKCKARVDKVGKDNYIEKLSNQAKAYKKPKSDLLISLNLIIKFMSIPVILIGVTLFIRMYFNDDVTFFNTVRKTAGAMIGMIPSGLFLMSSIALYVGVIRLGQRHVLVQELYCIEMLARVNCICLDKTGTITDGTMVVKNVIDYNQVQGLATKNIVSAILNALPDRNMTSEALINKFGLGRRMKSSAAIPFSSQRKYQAVTFDNYGTFILGAPEFALGEYYKRVAKDVEKYAKLGYRVLCLAHQDGEIQNGELPKAFVEVVAMILIEDNIRPDAIATIKYFKESGVEVRVISGDNPITVSKISMRAGVPDAENFVSLDGMSDVEVARAALKYKIFGRVSPNQKKIIIQTLKKADKTVAMTGDGVNDILALREADCSIALGSGSEATRNCSHLVLTDSNFGSMPSVVAEGRRVINNVTSVASLFLTKTFFSLLLGIIAIFTGVYPITPKQLILIDILAIGLPSLFLVNEPNNRPVKGRFLNNVIKKALPGAIVIVTLSVIIFALEGNLNLDDLSLTTIMAIVATHTSLMVLFKACKPFTTLRKILCTISYTGFILSITLLPNLLEFRPIHSLFEYTNSNAIIETLDEYPRVAVSSANYYVIDGKVNDLKTNNNFDTPVLTRANSENYNYAINNSEINVEIEIPDINYDKYGKIYAGGYKINDITYYTNIEDDLIIDRNGMVYLSDYTNPLYTTLTKENEYYGYNLNYGASSDADSATVQYCILPTVEIEGNNIFINDEQWYITPSFAQMAAMNELDVTINITPGEHYLELLVNGEAVKKSSTSSETYFVSMPTVSTIGNRLNSSGEKEMTVYFDAVNTGITVFELYGLAKALPSGVNTYTIYSTEEATDYEYVYYDEYDKVYKVIAGETVDLDNDLVADFTFENFATNDYASFTDVNGDAIKVNEAGSELSLDVQARASVYSIKKNDNLVTTEVSLSDKQFGPSIDVTEANHYIIEGWYTEYLYEGKNLNPTFYKGEDGKYYYKFASIKTDYEVSVNVTTGGLIRALSLTERIFCLCLCLAAAPLMKFLQYVVPWIKKGFQNLGKIVNKWQ